MLLTERFLPDNPNYSLYPKNMFFSEPIMSIKFEGTITISDWTGDYVEQESEFRGCSITHRFIKVKVDDIWVWLKLPIVALRAVSELLHTRKDSPYPVNTYTISRTGYGRMETKYLIYPVIENIIQPVEDEYDDPYTSICPYCNTGYFEEITVCPHCGGGMRDL